MHHRTPDLVTDPARSWFERLGFHVGAVLADCVIDKHGRTEDTVYMSYDVLSFHG